MPELGGRRAEDGCKDSFNGVGDDDSSNDEESLRMWDVLKMR